VRGRDIGREEGELAGAGGGEIVRREKEWDSGRGSEEREKEECGRRTERGEREGTGGGDEGGAGRESGRARGRMGEEREEGREGSCFNISSYTLVYLHIHSYTFIYIHIHPNASEYLQIPSYTQIYSKIFNIMKMRADMRHTNGHNSDTKPPTMSPEGLVHSTAPKNHQNRQL